MAKRDQEEEELSPDAQAEEGAVMEERRASTGAQAGKEAEARDVLAEALLSEDESGAIKKEKRKRSPGKRREVPEVVEKPPAREMGAPEFAELSSLSLLNAHEFAEPKDVNAFLEAELPPGTSLENLPDNEYRELLKKEEAFATFVAKRLVRESMDQILSRPVVPDSILERALEMHPETQAYAKAVEEARETGEALDKSLEVINDSRGKMMDVYASLQECGQKDLFDGNLIIKLDQRETALEKQREDNTALQEQLAGQAKEGKVSLDAKYREEMSALSKRVAGVMEKVAETSPGAIQRDASGQFRLDIAKLSREAKDQLGVFLAEETNEVLQAERVPEARQKELNLRLLLETDWMQDFALEDIQNAQTVTTKWSRNDQEFGEDIPLIWSTAVDVLQTGNQDRQSDPGVLDRFLRTESYLFEHTGSYNNEGKHVPRFEQAIPSVLPFVIEQAKNDAGMAERLFASRGLIEGRLRTVYPGKSWDSAREQVLAQIESIAKNLGTKYRGDKNFQALLADIAGAIVHQTSIDQQEKVIDRIAPLVDTEVRQILANGIQHKITRGRQMDRWLLQDLRSDNPTKVSRLIELLRRVDQNHDLIRWIDWQDDKISWEEYQGRKT